MPPLVLLLLLLLLQPLYAFHLRQLHHLPRFRRDHPTGGGDLSSFAARLSGRGFHSNRTRARARAADLHMPFSVRNFSLAEVHVGVGYLELNYTMALLPSVVHLDEFLPLFREANATMACVGARPSGKDDAIATTLTFLPRTAGANYSRGAPATVLAYLLDRLAAPGAKLTWGPRLLDVHENIQAIWQAECLDTLAATSAPYYDVSSAALGAVAGSPGAVALQLVLLPMHSPLGLMSRLKYNSVFDPNVTRAAAQHPDAPIFDAQGARMLALNPDPTLTNTGNQLIRTIDSIAGFDWNYERTGVATQSPYQILPSQPTSAFGCTTCYVHFNVALTVSVDFALSWSGADLRELGAYVTGTADVRGTLSVNGPVTLSASTPFELLEESCSSVPIMFPTPIPIAVTPCLEVTGTVTATATLTGSFSYSFLFTNTVSMGAAYNKVAYPSSPYRRIFQESGRQLNAPTPSFAGLGGTVGVGFTISPKIIMKVFTVLPFYVTLNPTLTLSVGFATPSCAGWSPGLALGCTIEVGYDDITWAGLYGAFKCSYCGWLPQGVIVSGWSSSPATLFSDFDLLAFLGYKGLCIAAPPTTVTLTAATASSFLTAPRAVVVCLPTTVNANGWNFVSFAYPAQGAWVGSPVTITSGVQASITAPSSPGQYLLWLCNQPSDRILASAYLAVTVGSITLTLPSSAFTLYQAGSSLKDFTWDSSGAALPLSITLRDSSYGTTTYAKWSLSSARGSQALPLPQAYHLAGASLFKLWACDANGFCSGTQLPINIGYINLLPQLSGYSPPGASYTGFILPNTRQQSLAVRWTSSGAATPLTIYLQSAGGTTSYAAFPQSSASGSDSLALSLPSLSDGTELKMFACCSTWGNGATSRICSQFTSFFLLGKMEWTGVDVGEYGFSAPGAPIFFTWSSSGAPLPLRARLTSMASGNSETVQLSSQASGRGSVSTSLTGPLTVALMDKNQEYMSAPVHVCVGSLAVTLASSSVYTSVSTLDFSWASVNVIAPINITLTVAGSAFKLSKQLDSTSGSSSFALLGAAAQAPTGQYTATACDTAGFCASAAPITVVCPANTFSAAGSSSCTPCSAGAVSAPGDAACKCAAGSTLVNGLCAACPAGTSSAAGDAYCTPCQAGQTAAAGSVCTASLPGTAAPGGRFVKASGVSVRWAPGYPSSTLSYGLSSCTPCANRVNACGTLAIVSDAFLSALPEQNAAFDCSLLLPTTCPAGSAAAAGSSSCTPCSAGYTSTSGAASCTQCPSGQTTAAAGSSACIPQLSCSPGQYYSAGLCQACAAGSAGGGGSATSCPLCGLGQYSARGAAACSSCPSGQTSSAGSTSSAACSTGSSPATVALAVTLAGYPASAVGGGAVTQGVLASLTASLTAATSLSCPACTVRILTVSDANSGASLYTDAQRALQGTVSLAVTAAVTAPSAAAASTLASAAKQPAFSSALTAALPAGASIATVTATAAQPSATPAASAPPTSAAEAPSPGPPLGAIVGGAVGGALALGALAYYLSYSNAQQQRRQEQERLKQAQAQAQAQQQQQQQQQQQRQRASARVAPLPSAPVAAAAQPLPSSPQAAALPLPSAPAPAAQASLPEGWALAGPTEEGHYFYTGPNGESQYEPPVAAPRRSPERAVQQQQQQLRQGAGLGGSQGLGLPEGWTRAGPTEEGLYYYLGPGGESRWDPPAAAGSWNRTASPAIGGLVLRTERAEQGAKTLPEGWVMQGPTEEGHYYYLGPNGESQWEAPVFKASPQPREGASTTAAQSPPQYGRRAGAAGGVSGRSGY